MLTVVGTREDRDYDRYAVLYALERRRISRQVALAALGLRSLRELNDLQVRMGDEGRVHANRLAERRGTRL